MDHHPLSRLIDRVGVDPNGCWIWKGSFFRTGYGQFWHNGTNRLAHRSAYELLVGPIPDGLEIDHLCRVRACVNPRHLEAVTAQVNSLRSESVSGRNGRKTHCKHGHAFTPENTWMKGNGERLCRACSNRMQRERRERKRAA